jgi:hypothetical protein
MLYSPTCPYSGDIGFAQMSVSDIIYLMNIKEKKRKEKERKKE